jgi:predicted dehydrogenase
MSQEVRMGLIGLGGAGGFHISYLQGGEISRCKLTAVCDADPGRLSAFSEIKTYTDSKDLIRSGEVDAVLIATPHYFHTPIGIDALEQGLHVLVEKPISVHKADCERLLSARRSGSQVFSAMLPMRTFPAYIEIKQLIDSGQLGRITRINWILTDWFRTDAYYGSVGWRGTWKGEGGGVLVNQCPHQLDLLQWFVGMPSKVRAFCDFGAYHAIEVEDQVAAYMEFPNGANAVFISNTGETPGTCRLEIVGEMGKVLFVNQKLTFAQNEVSMIDFCKTSLSPFQKPNVQILDIPIPTDDTDKSLQRMTQNFVDAILDGSPLIAPAEEGIRSVELANSMIYSTLTDSTIELPLDGAAYEAVLNALIEQSNFQKQTVAAVKHDFTQSFHK